MGPSSTKWEFKSKEDERHSGTVLGNLNPTWQFATILGLPEAHVDWELHVRVMDSDYLSFDDFLGECRVPLSELNARGNELHDYWAGVL